MLKVQHDIISKNLLFEPTQHTI